MKLFFIFISTLFLLFSSMNGVVYGANTTSLSDNHTAQEEAEGKAIWEKLQSKQLECKNLTDDNFEVLGEYFMGQMAGSSHEAMNNMMIRMMGSGFGNMMGSWGGFGIFDWITMLFFWLLLILGVVALLRYLGASGGYTRDNKTPLEILKERYAKGDIDKKEYEERKKDLS